MRVAPNEIHITDVSLYKTIYDQKGRYIKAPSFYDGFPIYHSLFTETNAVLHKERRKMMNSFFSTAGIHKIEHVMQNHVQGFKQKLERVYNQGKGQCVNGANAFRCVTVDIITEYAFAKSLKLVETSDDEFGSEFHGAFDAAVDGVLDALFNQCHFKFGQLLPKAVIQFMAPTAMSIFNLLDESAACWEAYKASPKRDIPVIFDELKHLNNDEWIIAEAMDVLVAGSDTTTFTLVVGVYHICKNPAIKKKLREALEAAIPDAGQVPNLQLLESIEYLTACVNESLRHAMPVPGRLPRVVPQGEAPLMVDGKEIPAGTVVGMSAYTMHYSEELWGSDAREFRPERWIGEEGKGLDAFFVPFSKGARSCIGQNLARSEIRMMLAMLYRSFDLELNPKASKKIEGNDFFTAQVIPPGTLFDVKEVIQA